MFLVSPYHFQVRAILVASPLRETSLATDRGARNTALHLAAEWEHPVVSGGGDGVWVWEDYNCRKDPKNNNESS